MTNVHQYGLDFSEALRQLKQGQKIAREGWNGKGMHLQMVLPANPAPPPADGTVVEPMNSNGVYYHVDGVEEYCLPWIGMKTADNKFVPWLASQTDVLANDWCVGF